MRGKVLGEKVGRPFELSESLEDITENPADPLRTDMCISYDVFGRRFAQFLILKPWSWFTLVPGSLSTCNRSVIFRTQPKAATVSTHTRLTYNQKNETVFRLTRRDQILEIGLVTWSGDGFSIAAAGAFLVQPLAPPRQPLCKILRDGRLILHKHTL